MAEGWFSQQTETLKHSIAGWQDRMPRWRPTRQQRRLRQAVLVGLAMAGVVLAIQQLGLFASAQARSSNYLYDVQGDPGDDILIVAIDEQSLGALGDWPLPFEAYTRLFQQLGGASAVGFDVLLPNAGPEGNAEARALVQAVRDLGTVVVPLAALELAPPDLPGDLYTVGQAVRAFPDLLDAAAAAGSVNQPPDRDGTLRRVPLLVDVGGDEVWEAFALRTLRLSLGLDAAGAASLEGNMVVIGDEDEVQYEVRADVHSAVLVNFVGRPNTFPTHSLVDVLEGRVSPDVFEGRIVLVGVMNALTEMDLHQTPVSTGRMSGVEFQANALHTLLNHRELVRQSEAGEAVVVVVLALVSALVISQLGAVLGAVFALFLALAYLGLTSILFNQGLLPRVLLPYITILLNYAAVTATRFASERGERRQVTDIFGRFVSAEVRNVIVNLALEDPDLVRPGGRQVEISVLFADIRGFTTISENLAPSEVVEILNLYLESMEDVVFKHGGTVDKYTGDGMMVLFGAPLEQPDHAERAVRAALAMQAAAAEVSACREEGACEIAYGIGLATGPAVVGHIGSSRRLDYTAIGDTVNLASRLEGQAPPGTIWINQTAYEAVKEIAEVERLRPVQVKGKVRPVPVYRLLGIKAVGAGVQPAPNEGG